MGPFDRDLQDRWRRHAPNDPSGFGEDDSDASPSSMEYLRKLEDSVRTGRLEYKERVQSTTRLNRTIKQVPEQEVVIRGVQNDLDKSEIPLPGQQIRARARQAAAARVERPVTPGTDGSFAVGTILRFEDHSLGVFKDARTDKDYEVVYLLLADGTVRPQGMALESYDVKVLGKLPPEFVHRLQRRLTWKRDEVIFHLEHFDYCEMIPHPDPDAIVEDEEEAPEAESDGHNLVRGRRLTLSFGPGQAWQAIYWGEDDLGPLVAHKTAENWALMHLDLSRFADSMQVGAMADEQLMAEIDGDLAIA